MLGTALTMAHRAVNQADWFYCDNVERVVLMLPKWMSLFTYSHGHIYIHIPTVHMGSSYTFDSCGPTTVCLTSPLDLALRQGSQHCVATSPHRDGCLATPTAAPLELPAPRSWVCEHRPFPEQKTPWIWRVVTTVVLVKSWLQENQLFKWSRWLMMIVYRWPVFINTRCRFRQRLARPQNLLPWYWWTLCAVAWSCCTCYRFWIQGTLLEKPMTHATISLSVARWFYPLSSHAAGGKVSLASFASAMRVAMV